MTTPTPSPAEHGNTLADQISPYLRQHADNPVHWQPWGDAAFERAERENRPIFLSVGYSTCHWCHVMAHESFEDAGVAELLNAHFVPIKVDREELPDVDAQYMLATQAFYMLSGQSRAGGWPNSVWLLPDGRPFFAGTYFPKPQFTALLQRIADIYRHEHDKAVANAEAITNAMQRLSDLDASGGAKLDHALVRSGLNQLVGRYDPEHGGFGSRPKFPPHGTLRLLLAWQAKHGEQNHRQIITHTLDAMAAGGIYDHVGGGFHRYATDAHWFVPHFEKMLYDNAQLVGIYADAVAMIDDKPRYRQVIAETFDWLDREMSDEADGFYSALDADSEGEEGKFYVWSYDEIQTVLDNDDADLFVAAYGIQPNGNWHEEATGEPTGTNIPTRARSDDELADAFGQSPESIARTLTNARRKLREQRDQRIRPHLDDKVLTSWNALMIEALARAGRQLDEPAYTRRATQAATFILEHLRDPAGNLLRAWREGVTRQPGYHDDYAYFIAALLALEAATDEPRWRQTAIDLADRMIDQFGDRAADDQPPAGFFYTSAAHDEVIMRSKNAAAGGNMPNPNGVAAAALLELGRRTGKPRFTRAAVSTLQTFAGLMQAQPFAAEELLAAAHVYLHDDAAKTSASDMSSTATDAAAAPPEAESITEPLTIRAYLPADLSTDTLPIQLLIMVDPPYHIYAPQPGDENVVPLSISLQANAGLTLDGIDYPQPSPMKDEATGRTLNVYEEAIGIVATLRITDRDAARRQPFTLRIRAQACDDRSCLEPQTHDLQLQLPG